MRLEKRHVVDGITSSRRHQPYGGGMDIAAKRGVISNIIGCERWRCDYYLKAPEAMNAFSGDIRKKLLAYLSNASTRDDVSCVGITGTGKAFFAGGDIAAMIELQDNNDTSVIESRISVPGEIL
jgi:hypothetical protein